MATTATRTNEVPRDVEAERLVCGALMDHTAYEVAVAVGAAPVQDLDHLRVLREVADAGLRAGDFFDVRYRTVFAAINWLLEAGRPVTAETVYRVCAASKNVEHHIPAAWFAALAESTFTTYEIGWWAARIVEQAKRRRLMAAGEVIATGQVDSGQASALVDTLQAQAKGEAAVTRGPWPPVVGPQ